MKITKLVLKKYKRLMMSNIQCIEYDPTKTMQLLIGSNGSGKSSILEELTPIPAHHSGFDKGGLKEIHVEHRGVDYVLISNYDGGSGRHSFKRDGEELNEGGTFAIQRELVEQEFRLNRKVHELMIGLETFTGMSTAKRREWLTTLSTVDLSYAFEVYNRVKSAQRDQLGVIKHLTKRMAGENMDLPDDSQMTQMRENIKRLTNKLNDLFLHRKQHVSAGFRDEYHAQQQLNQLLDRARNLLKLYPRIPSNQVIKDKETFAEELNEQFAQHRTMVAVVDQMVEELEGIRKKVPSKDDNLSPEQIQEIRDHLQDQLDTAKGWDMAVEKYSGEFPLVHLPIHGDPLRTLNEVFDRWSKLISTFPENESGRMNSADARTNKERLTLIKGQLRQVEDKQTIFARRLATLRGCEEVVCPSCTHSFKPGVDVSEIGTLEQNLEKLGGMAERLAAEIKQLTEWLEEYDEYAAFVYNFRQLTQDYQQFQDLWDYCSREQVMFRTPRRYMSAALAWRQTMEDRIVRDMAMEKAAVLRKKLQYVEAIDQDVVGYLDQRRVELETQIENRSHEMQLYKQRLNDFQRAGRDIQTLSTDIERLLGEFSQFSKNFQQQLEYLVQRALEEETKITQLQMAEQQRQLSALEMREHTLQAIEREHEEAIQLHADLGLLVKSLSPTDGLIGRYLMGFMQVMVKLMNAVINEIWTYPLEILPSKVDKDELDYNFPLQVSGGQVTAPDIARGSSSQRDVVNFAFKLMAMKFLNFEDYPLYLDEFGSTFDEQHRQNLIPFIARMIELGQIRQLFYISHFDATHGAFNQAEIFVLDPTNITVPQRYNEHVKIS